MLLIVCPLVTLGKPQSGLFDLTLTLEGPGKEDEAVVSASNIVAMLWGLENTISVVDFRSKVFDNLSPNRGK